MLSKLFFAKSFLENTNWTFINVLFSNYKKTFTNFISLFYIINFFFNLKKIIDIFICLTPYPRIYLTPCIQFTLWIVCPDCAPGMPGLGFLCHCRNTIYMLSIIGIGISVMLRETSNDFSIGGLRYFY